MWFVTVGWSWVRRLSLGCWLAEIGLESVKDMKLFWGWWNILLATALTWMLDSNVPTRYFYLTKITKKEFNRYHLEHYFRKLTQDIWCYRIEWQAKPCYERYIGLKTLLFGYVQLGDRSIHWIGLGLKILCFLSNVTHWPLLENCFHYREDASGHKYE